MIMANPRNANLIHNARSLRKNMPKEERRLWYNFLRHCSPRFRRQEIVGNYIADFYCDKAKLVLELDGSQHLDAEQLQYDMQRTKYFESLGMLVVRYYNTDILSNFDGVCQNIIALLLQRGIHPSVTFGDSSPRGEPLSAVEE